MEVDLSSRRRGEGRADRGEGGERVKERRGKRGRERKGKKEKEIKQR